MEHKYIEFRNFLKEFITLVNKNQIIIKDKLGTNYNQNLNKTNLKNLKNYKTNKEEYDIINIDNIEFHSHLYDSRWNFYGPKNGREMKMFPFICYGLGDGSLANIRIIFNNYKAEKLKLVIWKNKNEPNIEIPGVKNTEFSIDDLELSSEEDPNSKFITFYDTFVGIENKIKSSNISEFSNKISNTLLSSKNIILHGAPGTGKSYITKHVASLITGIGIDELDSSDQYEFVQFHPSYDYTDFVEGLRPVKADESDEISFELVDGIFKRFCKKAYEAKFVKGADNFKDAWEKLINKINESKEDYMMENSTNPATINSKGNIKFKSSVATKEHVYNLYKEGTTDLKYKTYPKIVLEHLKDPKNECKLDTFKIGKESKVAKKFVFVIDEINRGEISKIFGELFFSIDPGYRGDKYGILTQYSNLHENKKEKFFIPDNVYIIGTMNDIDRSVDSFDFAMRRRFRFIEIKYSDTDYMLDNLNNHEEAEKAKDVLESLNKAISKIEELNDNYHIGPSYFLKLEELGYNYDLLWKDFIKPLLEEYLRGSYNITDKLDKLEKAYKLNNTETDESNE